MDFMRLEGSDLIVENLFNEQHALELLPSIPPCFNAIVFRNVGIKIMKLIINAFEQIEVKCICVEYNWNQIMMRPKLVCYDKNQWKTLQQLHNWNVEWSQLFGNCYFLTCVKLKIDCSWMDEQFVQTFLAGVAKVPNMQIVQAIFGAKNPQVGRVLEAIEKAGIFGQFNHCFKQLK